MNWILVVQRKHLRLATDQQPPPTQSAGLPLTSTIGTCWQPAPPIFPAAPVGSALDATVPTDSVRILPMQTLTAGRWKLPASMAAASITEDSPDGKQNFLFVGEDLNHDGIPDALQPEFWSGPSAQWQWPEAPTPDTQFSSTTQTPVGDPQFASSAPAASASAPAPGPGVMYNAGIVASGGSGTYIGGSGSYRPSVGGSGSYMPATSTRRESQYFSPRSYAAALASSSGVTQSAGYSGGAVVTNGATGSTKVQSSASTPACPVFASSPAVQAGTFQTISYGAPVGGSASVVAGPPRSSISLGGPGGSASVSAGPPRGSISAGAPSVKHKQRRSVEASMTAPIPPILSPERQGQEVLNYRLVQ